MSEYDVRNDPFWGEVEASVDGYSRAIAKLLKQRHALVEACTNVMLCAAKGDRDSLANALQGMDELLREITTVWCDQCGDRPAHHSDGVENLCDLCYAKTHPEEDE